MTKQTKEQEICYINRNTKSITLTGEQINSLIEQGKAQAIKQVEKRFIDFTDKGYFIYKSVWEELKAQLEKLK